MERFSVIMKKTTKSKGLESESNKDLKERNLQLEQENENLRAQSLLKKDLELLLLRRLCDAQGSLLRLA